MLSKQFWTLGSNLLKKSVFAVSNKKSRHHYPVQLFELICVPN